MTATAPSGIEPELSSASARRIPSDRTRMAGPASTGMGHPAAQQAPERAHAKPAWMVRARFGLVGSDLKTRHPGLIIPMSCFEV